jgi:subtilisin
MTMKARLIPTAAYALALLLVGAAGSETLSAQTLPRIAPTVVESISSQGRTRVLVELAVADQPRGMSRRSAAQASEHRAKIAVQRQLLLSTLGRGGHRVVHEFANTPFVALEIDAAALAKLEAAPSVAVRVLEDSLLRPSLANSVPRIDANRAHAVGFNGTGSAVAVIDSGVDRTHPFFASRLIEEACFATAEIGSGGDCPNGQATQIGSGAATSCAFAPQACRHGTHVAGIAVGDGVEFSGVAPAANLIAIQVFHASLDCLIFFEEFPCPRAFASDIVAGLEHVYALRNQYNIASVNLSLGGTAYDSACDAESPLFAAAIGNLRSAGIATVAASGNDGLTYGISEPACVSAAISVGATDAYDEVAWFSNSSADLDLLAPGTPITSSVTGGGFDTLEGTSMAAPHVAGAWAIYKQAFPTATVDEALASFIDTGVPITDWLRGGPTKPRISVGTALGLESPAPVLDSVSPTEIARFGPNFTLTVDGSSFVSVSQVYVDGIPQSTTYVDDTRLTATISSDAIDTTNSAVTITVYTPPAGGGTSNAVTLGLLTSSVEVDATLVSAGDVVNATVINPPGRELDWLALVEVGAPATSYLAFVYVGTGVTNFTWSVAMPQTSGEYEFRLFANNGYTQLAVSAPITVVEPEPEPEPGPTTLTPSTNSAAPGDAVTLTVADAPGGATDWLALANVDAPATTFLKFVYVGAGVTDRTWTVDMPQTSGEYEFRLFANNGYTELAVSPPVTVE